MSNQAIYLVAGYSGNERPRHERGRDGCSLASIYNRNVNYSQTHDPQFVRARPPAKPRRLPLPSNSLSGSASVCLAAAKGIVGVCDLSFDREAAYRFDHLL